MLSYGLYAQGSDYEDGYPMRGRRWSPTIPRSCEGSTNKYQSWEVDRPRTLGAARLRLHARGYARRRTLARFHRPQLLREIDDFYECIEWAAEQDWTNGKVGMVGISYYATNQWRVAGLEPPHLAAICIWEGYADRYRDSTHHGGILTTFQKNWQEMQVRPCSTGSGARPKEPRHRASLVCGPVTLSEEELATNRVNGDE